jgi:hypothetical protein
MGQNIPQWIVESKNLKAHLETYVKYEFEGKFQTPPVVTATARSTQGKGLADLSILRVTKQYVEFTISAAMAGLRVQIHAMGLKQPPDCPCLPNYGGDCVEC